MVVALAFRLGRDICLSDGRRTRQLWPHLPPHPTHVFLTSYGLLARAASPHSAGARLALARGPLPCACRAQALPPDIYVYARYAPAHCGFQASSPASRRIPGAIVRGQPPDLRGGGNRPRYRSSMDDRRLFHDGYYTGTPCSYVLVALPALPTYLRHGRHTPLLGGLPGGLWTFHGLPCRGRSLPWRFAHHLRARRPANRTHHTSGGGCCCVALHCHCAGAWTDSSSNNATHALTIVAHTATRAAAMDIRPLPAKRCPHQWRRDLQQSYLRQTSARHFTARDDIA